MSTQSLNHASIPLTFDCYLRPQVWGGRRLEAFLQTSLPADQTIGEAWVLSGHPLHISRALNGPSPGTTLVDVHEQFVRDAGEGAASQPQQFPWLIKFLDCQQLLSVQVHPDDDLAARFIPGERGKTEAWVVLDADPGAVIYAGLKPGMTRSRLEKALDDGAVAECLHRIAPRPGDCIFLPAGTVHAVGGGVLMAEIQQTSDATFRLYDWNRIGTDGKPRQLHRTEALACIDWNQGPVRRQIPRKIPKLPHGVTGESLVECAQFCVSRFQLDRPWRPTQAAPYGVWVVLRGSIEIESENPQPAQVVRRGGTVLITPSQGSFRLCPGESTELLHVTVGVPAVAESRIAA